MPLLEVPISNNLLSSKQSSSSNTATELTASVFESLLSCKGEVEALTLWLEANAALLLRQDVVNAVKEITTIPAALSTFEPGTYLNQSQQAGLLRLMLNISAQTFNMGLIFMKNMTETTRTTVWPSIKCGFSREGKDWLIRNFHYASGNHFLLLQHLNGTSFS